MLFQRIYSLIYYGNESSPNSHYEKFILTGEVKCIDDEIPFELPKGWEWCRLGEVGDWGAGATPLRSNPKFFGGHIPWLKTGELNYDVIFETEECITKKALQECSLRLCSQGDVLIAMYGATIGKLGIAGIELTTNQACCACTPILFYNMFLFYYLMASKQVFVEQGEGGAQPNISRIKLVSHLFPLPPLVEQQRIVAKIEELMPLVEQYGKAQSELNKLNTNIREQLKKSILQYAIEGKLVPQYEEDGTAEDLLQEIQAEKQRLYAEGKLKKKDLTHSTIFRGEDNKYYEQNGKEVICIDEEIPFEIPVSWRWVRVKDVVKINPKNEYSDNTIAAFIPMEKIEATFLSEFSYTKVQWGGIKSSFTHFADGDVAFAKITPCFQNRKSIVLQNLPNGIGAGTTELKVLRPYTETIQSSFLMYFLETPYFVENASYKGTANQQRILVGYLENKLLALPPLNEQRKISNAITALLHLLD